ncbi:nucleoside-diphosphatase mig-23 [Biomphalaria pfeifferi]|uniref:Nucleoside-diphosphatase mig-23 n=1 Tax=Biomphalaria pfeifferi TaxID=112525 RepID=A0AAD8BRG2_BIOPF|nr:nucleoside-diphosphatase mig-23 [Biomphalaria pfeifferi]
MADDTASVFVLSRTLLLLACLLSQHTTSSGPTKSPTDAKDYVGFGVLLDGGSSGTKMKVYGWKPPTATKRVPTVELLRTRRFSPGVHTLYSHWVNMTRYIGNIVEAARLAVPREKHTDTPIYMMATAGVRTLSLRETSILFDHIRLELANSGFSYHPQKVDVLSGEEEAVYSWIAANYLLGFFDTEKADDKSIGILEMGGVSMQIAFIPHEPMYAEEFQVTVAGKKYQLYAQSYMKYGSDALNERVANMLASAVHNGTDLNNPCMLKGDQKNVTLENGVTYGMIGTSSPSQCQAMFEQILQPNQGFDCQPKPCAIGSVHQPSVANISFYAIHGFTHAPKTLKAIGKNYTLQLDRLEQAAYRYCNQSFNEAGNASYASGDCLLGLYIPTLFTKSYGFKKNTTDIKTTSNIGNQSIDWALGVMLMELSSRFTYSSSHEYSVTCPTNEAGDVTLGYLRDSSPMSTYPSLTVFLLCYFLFQLACTMCQCANQPNYDVL